MRSFMIEKIVLTALAVSGLAGLVLAQQNQFRYDSYSQENGITTIHVQGNVYMLQGAGGNVAVQIGDMGVVVVDTGNGQNSDKLIAAIRKLSNKPIQYIVNTSMDAVHTGGNDDVRKAGVTITGANVAGNLTDATAGAAIIAHENVLNRMSAPTGQKAVAPFGAWPTITYVTGQNELYFNEEPIEARWQPAAHTDGDSLVVLPPLRRGGHRRHFQHPQLSCDRS